MKKFLTTLTILIFTFFLQGCNEYLQIQGSNHIYINESQLYKVTAITDDIEDADSHQWKVKSKNKDYTLINSDSAEITFNAQSVGSYILQVKAKKGHKTLKAEIHIEVTEPEVINGHTLPSEPDKVINDSTLLGVDVNNNGVRDDVERWIFLKMKIYNGYEKIEQVIAMQQAKAAQMALADPANTDDKVHNAITAGLDCWSWYDYSKQLPLNDGIWDFINAIDDKCFNTKERLKTYLEYDASLSGRVFTSTPTLQTKTQCETDINGL